ncbi:MAG: hypothetical protein ACFBWO_07625 [Paracoccaceae bacterium]
MTTATDQTPTDLPPPARTRQDPALPDGAEAVPWLREALAVMRIGERGIAEATGRKRVHLIEAVNARIPLVSLAWCGLFVAHCLRKAEPDIDLPRFHARSGPWREVGRPCAPQLGAIMVYWYVAPWAPLGHVGFHVGEDDEAFHTLGGNQHDEIDVQRVPKERLVTARWPSTRTAPTGERPRRPREAAKEFEFGRLV